MNSRGAPSPGTLDGCADYKPPPPKAGQCKGLYWDTIGNVDTDGTIWEGHNAEDNDDLASFFPALEADWSKVRKRKKPSSQGDTMVPDESHAEWFIVEATTELGLQKAAVKQLFGQRHAQGVNSDQFKSSNQRK